MYKLINGNQTRFEELINEVIVEEVVDFWCSNDASKFVALVKISIPTIDPKAAAKIKTEAAAKVKADKAALAAKKAALKKELEAMEEE